MSSATPAAGDPSLRVSGWRNRPRSRGPGRGPAAVDRPAAASGAPRPGSTGSPVRPAPMGCPARSAPRNRPIAADCRAAPLRAPAPSPPRGRVRSTDCRSAAAPDRSGCRRPRAALATAGAIDHVPVLAIGQRRGLAVRSFGRQGEHRQAVHRRVGQRVGMDRQKKIGVQRAGAGHPFAQRHKLVGTRGSAPPGSGALRSDRAPGSAPSDRRCSSQRRRRVRSLQGRSRHVPDRGRSSADTAAAAFLARSAFPAPAAAPKPGRTSSRLRRNPPAGAARCAARKRYPASPPPTARSRPQQERPISLYHATIRRAARQCAHINRARPSAVRRAGSRRRRSIELYDPPRRSSREPTNRAGPVGRSGKNNRRRPLASAPQARGLPGEAVRFRQRRIVLCGTWRRLAMPCRR